MAVFDMVSSRTRMSVMLNPDGKLLSSVGVTGAKSGPDMEERVLVAIRP